MTAALEERVETVERQLRALRAELDDVKRELVAGSHGQPLRPPAATPAEPEPRPRASARPAAPPARRPRIAARRPVGPTLVERLEGLDVLGARGLALAGGIVTLLGIVFFFALAANRGWIGPEARVLLGAGASVAVFAAGLLVHRRLGQLHAALAAVGAGLAGGYMTLLAATALYDLVPEPLALAGAGAIAAAGTAVAIRWSSELLAGLGLVGALLVPLVPTLQEGPSAVAGGFAAIVFAGAAAVAVLKRWEGLLALSASVLAAQTGMLAVLGEPGDAGSVAAALAAALLVLAAGVAWQLAQGAGELAPPLAPLAGSLVLGSGGLALSSLVLLIERRSAEGVALLLYSLAPAAAGTAVLRRSRDLALACGASALALAAVGTADLVSGATLTVVWAAQAAALAWAGSRVREPRLQLASFVYLALATGHLVALEEPQRALFLRSGDQLAVVPGLVAVAAASIVVALHLPRLLLVRAGVDPRRTRDALLGLGLLAALVAVAELLVAASFGWGHLAAVVLWSLAGTALVALAARRGDVAIGVAGFAWLGVTLAKALWLDPEAFGTGRAVAGVAVASVAILLAGVLLRVLNATPRRLGIASAVAGVVAAAGLWACAVSAADVDGAFDRTTFLVWLGGAVSLYGALAGYALRTPRLRNLATALWLLALGYLVVLEAVLIDGRAVVVVYAATGALLALAGRVLGEPRLAWAACALVGATTLGVLLGVAPLDRFVEASDHPGTQAWAPLACAGAAAVLAWCLPGVWRWLAAAAAALGVYALSLAVLEAAERVSGASVQTDFERGHTAVTAVWALIGLGLLVAGLLRRSARLRYAGLGLFGVALAKLFLYDLSALSSITRAAAFLAVGGLLLAGGVFVQRLSARLDPRPGPPAGAGMH